MRTTCGAGRDDFKDLPEFVNVKRKEEEEKKHKTDA